MSKDQPENTESSVFLAIAQEDIANAASFIPSYDVKSNDIYLPSTINMSAVPSVTMSQILIPPDTIDNAFRKAFHKEYQFNNDDINRIGSQLMKDLPHNVVFKKVAVKTNDRGIICTDLQATLGSNISEFLKNNGKVFGIYNTGSNHWISYVLIETGSTIYAYYKDSLNKEYVDFVEDIQAVFPDEVVEVRKIGNSKEQIIEFEHILAPESYQHVNCGIFALRNMEILASTSTDDLLTNSDSIQFFLGGTTEKEYHDNFIQQRKALAEQYLKHFVEQAGTQNPGINEVELRTLIIEQLNPDWLRQNPNGPILPNEIKVPEAVKKSNDDEGLGRTDDPLTFNEKGHLIALKLDEHQAGSNRDRHIKDFEMRWDNIPVFAIITGSNGSGKSYLLEQIKKNISKNSGIKFTYLGPDQSENFSSSSTLGGEFNQIYRENREETELFIFNYIKGNINDYESSSYLKKYTNKILYENIIRQIAEYLLRNIDSLQEKDDNEIQKIIADQCKRPNFISNSSEIDYNVLTIVNSSIENYKKAKEDLSQAFKDYSRILDEPYAFWQEQNPDGTINDFKKFLKDKARVDDLIEQLVDKLTPVPDALQQINQVFPESFPYQLVKYLGGISCYPRHFDTRTESQIDATKLVRLEHMSSGEKIVMKVVSLVYYNQGLRVTIEERGTVVSKPNIILLDEPDRHLDPRLCKIFFNAVYNKLVLQEGIQVIMTTHRIDTVALAPENSIYILEKGALICQKQTALDRMSANIIPAVSKRSALSELSDGMLTVIKDIKYVMVEAKDDVIFYTIVYQKFLAAGFLKPYRTELIFTPAAVKAIDPKVLYDLGNYIKAMEQLAPHGDFAKYIKDCVKIVNFLKGSNEKDGGCQQVIDRVRIEKYDIQCDSKGKVTNDPKPLPKEARHEPEIIWGLLDKDKGRESENTIRALDDVYSIENYLCMPLNIFYLMKRNAFYSERNKFPSLKNLVSQKIAQTLEDNPDPNFVQQVVDYVIDYLKKQTLKHSNSLRIDYDRLEGLELACGVTIKCPEFFFKMRGHDLQGAIDLLIFENQNNTRMKSRIQGALEEIPAALLPASLLNTINDLILDRNYDVSNDINPLLGKDTFEAV